MTYGNPKDIFSIDPFGGAKPRLSRQGEKAPLPSTGSGH